MNFEVRTDSLAGVATALGWARGHTVVIDRPADGGGQDLGFNGGELLHLAVAGCVSNDLFREARALGLRLTRVEPADFDCLAELLGGIALQSAAASG